MARGNLLHKRNRHIVRPHWPRRPQDPRQNEVQRRCVPPSVRILHSVLHIELSRAIFAKIWDGWLFRLSDDDLVFEVDTD